MYWCDTRTTCFRVHWNWGNRRGSGIAVTDTDRFELTRKQSPNLVRSHCDILDVTCSRDNVVTNSFKKIVDLSKEDDMSVYGKLLIMVTAVNCLHIDLSRRDLTNVPNNINSTVTTLNLANNKIKSINATSLRTFQDLVILFLGGNEIHYINEEAFGNNPKLSELHLQGNRIESMTSSFGAAHKSLTKMQLWGAFTQEGAQTSNFSRCVNLQTLIIGYNIYKTLDASIFPHSLIELNMRYTGLEEFPDLTHQTTYLKTLDVYGNLISSIPTQRIEGLKYLEKLYIAANRIHVLPGLMKNSIKEITLAENPFTCDANVCDLRMLHEYWAWVLTIPARG